MKVHNQHLFANETGKTTTFSTNPIELTHIYGYAITAKWTQEIATLSGNITLEAAVEKDLEDSVWVEITGAQQAVSGSGTKLWNVAEVFYRRVRVTFTISSGTAALTCSANYKGI